jgi:phage baseplate assembly protein W
MATNVRYPYQFDNRGYTATADEDTWIRGLIEQVLFTAPGERVMRPDFGCGIAQLVFAPNSPELAATTQFIVQGALQQWLGNLITIEAVDVLAEESTLRVAVQYIVRRSQKRQLAEFSRAGVGL